MGSSATQLSQYGSGQFGNPPIESLPLGYYEGLLTSQYCNSPKLNAFLKMLLQKFQDISQCQAQLDMAFDVDNAIGVQLDAVGAIVGANRTVGFQPTGGLSPTLGDSDYRIYIKAVAAANSWDGTIDSLYSIWSVLFPSGTITIADSQNMTATIILTGTFSAMMQQLITNGYIVPRPEGVLYSYTFSNPRDVILQDANGVLWKITLDDSGILHSTVVASGTIFAPKILDSNGSGNVWQLGITISGELTTTNLGSGMAPLSVPFLTSGSLFPAGLSVSGGILNSQVT
jgi:hypothetical protein